MQEYHAEKWMSLEWAIKNAISLATIGSNDAVKLIFNDILLTVFYDSKVQDIAEIYRLKRKCGEYEK